MAQFLNSMKLYLCLVLVPQLVYLLTSRYGFAAVCESCSPSTDIDMYLRLLQESPDSQHSTSLPSPDDGKLSSKTCSAGVDKDDQSSDQECLPSPCSCSNTEEHRNTSSKVERQGSVLSIDLDAVEGGWHIPHSLPDLSGPCNIKRRNVSLSQMDFLKDFAFREPVILSGISDQSIFRTHSTKSKLLRDFGDEIIIVATANTHSYRKVKMTFCEYVEKYMKPQTLESLGNETLYHFGDNDRDRWDPLFSLYELPPYQLPNQEPVLSFGLAGPGTGVPFHIHGPTFAETIFGRKRWFLYSPEHSPQFHPDVTTLHWVIHTYPNLTEEEKPFECTLGPGDVIYFPDRWWHATLNLDSAVFMSTFYS